MIIQPINTVRHDQHAEVGGKALSLARLSKAGVSIPLSAVIPAQVYGQYLAETSLGAKLSMELGRKEFSQMRWEELWDAALRIRNLFLTTPLPESLEMQLCAGIEDLFGDRPLVIRSSAPGEDSGQASFAGLHESVVHVRGRKKQLQAVRTVWASLWSDRALLYRQELGLSVEKSRMAVVVQELMAGRVSGVGFSTAPEESQQMAIEAVYGLNQGLVDGSVEPDSWRLHRTTLEIEAYTAAEKTQKLVPRGEGLAVVDTSPHEKTTPVLDSAECVRVAQTLRMLEDTFEAPQDCEWTIRGDDLILLQARPITRQRSEDNRQWYLGLHRSMENLKTLQRRIEEEILPAIEATAAAFAEVDPAELSDADLCETFAERLCARREWEEVYRRDCIPMAHGIRLFGAFYTDTVQPDDPFEFMELLRGNSLRAVARNQRLMETARALVETPEAVSSAAVAAIAEEIGLSVYQAQGVMMELGAGPVVSQSQGAQELEAAFRRQFSPEELPVAEEYLAMGRASYRLRDDDNISLEQLLRQVSFAEEEVRRRNAQHPRSDFAALLAQAEKEQDMLRSPSLTDEKSSASTARARQLQGQPASPGIATGVSRVVRTQADLSGFQRGEILVCDAIDPAMTFIVPLAGAIVERRGGMLIHGAIIAREYGIPCVSGVARVADIVETGEELTVDGNLGLVFLEVSRESSPVPIENTPFVVSWMMPPRDTTAKAHLRYRPPSLVYAECIFLYTINKREKL
ncbi:PEP/pyruvate-binding domain-containing protein [Chitinivibrio alkaliphilus]|uniref:Phosphoenolpyruvate synthase n=1 Tax=Chitinivibrio alkaliphilus ACht1 TaxID=1313304 RepID=U7D2F4_9BACT|nr:PEP/pyruvate-binding domain-containing protein [Chitinivibrio alkaliphilus]ERP30684.1 phosphoenolpyruvate synthase [Chitinivibrio alkaliphilus ACht1]